MRTSDNGRALIEAFEGLFLTAYRDVVNKLTIGYGHTSEAGAPNVTAGMKITADQADEILEADLVVVERNVEQCIKVPLKQHEFDALVSFDFNTGDLRKSSIDDKLNAGDRDAALATLLQYNHAGGKVYAGLTRRRKAEKMMFLGNVAGALALAGAHVSMTPVSPKPPPDIEPPNAPPLAQDPIPQQPASGGFFVALLNLILSIFKRK